MLPRATVIAFVSSTTVGLALLAEYRTLSQGQSPIDDSPPRLVLSNIVCDLGVVARGKPHATSFVVKNVGFRRLVIHDANQCCGQDPKPALIVPSRASRHLAVTLTPTSPGTVEQRYTFTTNDPEHPEFTLVVRGHARD